MVVDARILRCTCQHTLQGPLPRARTHIMRRAGRAQRLRRHAQSRAARGAHEAIDAAVARLGEDLGEDAERVEGLLERADRLDLLLELGE